jgi:predicted dehydrogenase
MKKWRIGIVGAGLIAGFHAEAVKSLENATLAGVCGTNTGKAKKLADKYGCKLFENQSAMLGSGEVDLVIIATPSGAHMEPTIEAAENGKHVLCEKPLDISLERIDKMIEAHQKAGTWLGGIFNFRFDETTEIIKKAVLENRFGVLTSAMVAVPWWRSDGYYEGWHGTWDLDGGGALMNQSIHMIDLLQYMMGPVEQVAAFISKTGHPQIETEDTGVAVLKFKNKALGLIYGTTASWPGQNRRMEITGTKGSVVLVENRLQTWEFDKMTKEDEDLIKKYRGQTGSFGVADPAAMTYHNHAKNIAAFIKSIEEKRQFEIDGTEARKAVALILDIYRSAKTGEVITCSNH